MDDTDRKLLTLLAENARLPVATLAKQLGLARSTAQARLERLETSGAIAGYTLRTGAALRAPIAATVLLRLQPRAAPGVLQRLKAMIQVTEVHITSGRFDMALRVSTATTEELDSLLDEIVDIAGVDGSESLIHLSTKINRGI